MLNKEVPADTRKSAIESDYAALYAVAGLTDALAEAFKGALTDTQQKASKRLSELQSKRPGLSKQAKLSAEELRTFVITLPEQFKNLPETTKARVAELQKQAARLDELGIAHGGVKDAHYGSGVSFRDPDGIALEFFAPPA